MDKIKAFFEAMTFWNWLALIAFIVLPLSALNAFLSLKSRYKDWNARQSKAKFEKRISQLKEELSEIHEYRHNLTKFISVTMGHLAGALYMFVVAFLTGIGWLSTMGTYKEKAVSKVFFILFFLFTSISIIRALARLLRLRRLVYNVRVPESVGERMIKLMETAKIRGWITEDDNSILTDVLNHTVFTETESTNLETFAGVEKVKRITRQSMSSN
ncbi:MAG TPA: hypothetical protein VJM08_13505 [Anaerolineales bacterium]|nr:hypothetical protein [Anaerolineales bacterium]